MAKQGERIDNLPANLKSHKFAEGPWCFVLANAKSCEPIYCAGKQLILDAGDISVKLLVQN